MMSKPGNTKNNQPTVTRKAGTPARVGTKMTGSAPLTPSKPVTDSNANANALKPASKVEWKPGASPPTREAIAQAAYFLWRERGGSEIVNWLEAEARLRRQPAR